MTHFRNKSVALCMCLLMVFSLVMPVFAATPTTDYEGHWAKEAILSATTSGISKGYPDGSFKPDHTITRAEFFSLINNAFEFTQVTEALYNDVVANAWYAPIIAKAKAGGYITGYPDGSIRPEGNITRQEVAVIFFKLKMLQAAESSADGFGDLSHIAPWAKGAVGAVVKAAIMKGYPDNTFRPEGLLTRAEAVTAVNGGLLVAIAEQGAPLAVPVVPVVIPTPSTGGGGGGGGGSVTPTIVAVSAITVTSETGATAMVSGLTLQMRAAITPAQATDKTIIWSVHTTEKIKVQISTSGLLSAVGVGDVTVTATNTASGVKGTQVVTVIPPMPVPSVSVGSQNGNLYPSIDGTATFAVRTMLIPDGQPGVITFFDENQLSVEGPFPAFMIDCTNVLNNGAMIRVSAQHPGSGTYYFKVTINGVTSHMITLMVIPTTAVTYFTFDAKTGIISDYNKAGGLDVVVPNRISGIDVTGIGPGALAYMEEAGLNSVVLPDGLLRIGRAALSDSNITSIMIPNSVTHIEGLALNCHDLKRVTIGSGVIIEDNLMSLYADRNNNYFREAYLALGAGTYIGSTYTNEANGTWAKLGKVSEVTVYGAGNATTLSSGGTLQMFANVVLLEDATDTTITWSVASGTGTATISETGLLTATGVGTVTVTATNAASGVKGTKVITVNTPAPTPSVAVGTQIGELYATTDGEATFAVRTMLIPDGQPGVITFFDEHQLSVVEPFTALTIDCSNVNNNGALISVSGQHAASGTYYFKVTINGVTSSMITLVVTPTTATSSFTFDGVTKTITDYDVSIGGAEVVIPITIGGILVEKIGIAAFDNKGLTSVVLPSSITLIGDEAFAINNLTTIIIPSGVTRIGNEAFSRNNLRGVIIPNGVTYIGGQAFWRNKLTSITIPNSVTTIAAEAFRENELTTVSIGTGINQLSSKVFASNKLTVLTIPNNIETIIEGALIENQLTQITIGSKVFLDANILLLNDANNYFRAAYNAPSGDAGTYHGSQTGPWEEAITLMSIPQIVAPVTGEAPITTAIDTTQYTGTVAWMPVGNPFTTATVYTATIVLTAKTGFTLWGVSENAFSVAGAVSSNAANAGIVEAVFPETYTLTPVNSVTITPNSMELIVGGATGTLAASVLPNDATNKTISWSSSNTGVATVKDGVVTAIKAGTATITATSVFDGTKSAQSIVTVPETYPLGPNVTGRLVSDTLTITGTGEMTNYANFSDSPIANNNNIHSIIIEDGITKIGNYVFSGCAQLTSITIKEDVTSVGNGAFRGCSSLENIIVPSKVSVIGASTFSECTGLTSVTLNGSVTIIGNSAFYNCSSLLGITLPDSVVVVADSAFYGCTKLKSIVIPDGVPSIGDYAFFQCRALESISIPNSLTSIGNSAFQDCGKLSNLILPTGLTTIGDWAFGNCNSLIGVAIPNKVTNIGIAAFGRCTSLKAITVDAANTAYSDTDGIVYNKAKTELMQCPAGKSGDLTIPIGVKVISPSAFMGCSGLTSITLPESMESIGERAFWGCAGVSSITIPLNVTSIASTGFMECSALTSIKMMRGDTVIGNNLIAYNNDFRITYLAGGIGTYTKSGMTWTKQ